MFNFIKNKIFQRSEALGYDNESTVLNIIEKNSNENLKILQYIKKYITTNTLLLRSNEQKFIFDIIDNNINTNYKKVEMSGNEDNLKNNFLLFNYFLHLPIFSGNINLGDYVQTIAVKNILDNLYNPNYFWYDRDNISFFRSSVTNNNPICCIMQGWFSHSYTFLPPSNVLPVWIGTHFTSTIHSFLRKVLVVFPNYFSSTVGCRDLSTLRFFRKNHISSYFSRCLTLTFPLRNSNKNANNIYIVDVPSHLMEYIPRSIKDNSIYVNQRFVNVQYEHWTDSLIRTKNLLDEYKNSAKLVITTALHCASPCIAMGIPVILIDNTIGEKNPRFSALSGIINPINIDDLKRNKIDWSPSPVNIEKLKDAMIKNVSLSVDEVLYRKESNETKEIRKFIENFRV